MPPLRTKLAARCLQVTQLMPSPRRFPPIRRQALRLPVVRRPLVPQLRARKRTDYSVRRNGSFPPPPSLSKSRPPPPELWPDAAHGHNTGVVKSSAGDLTTAAAEFSERYAADAAQGTAELLSLVLTVRALRERVMPSRSTRTRRVYPLFSDCVPTRCVCADARGVRLFTAFQCCGASEVAVTAEAVRAQGADDLAATLATAVANSTVRETLTRGARVVWALS